MTLNAQFSTELLFIPTDEKKTKTMVVLVRYPWFNATKAEEPLHYCFPHIHSGSDMITAKDIRKFGRMIN